MFSYLVSVPVHVHLIEKNVIQTGISKQGNLLARQLGRSSLGDGLTQGTSSAISIHLSALLPCRTSAPFSGRQGGSLHLQTQSSQYQVPGLIFPSTTPPTSPGVYSLPRAETGSHAYLCTNHCDLACAGTGSRLRHRL